MKFLTVTFLSFPLLSTAATVTLTGSGMLTTTDPFPAFTQMGATETSSWPPAMLSPLVVSPLPGAPSGATLTSRTITGLTIDFSGELTISGNNPFPATGNYVIVSGLATGIDDGMSPSSLQQNTTTTPAPVPVASGSNFNFTRNYSHTHVVPQPLLSTLVPSSTTTSFQLPNYGGAFFVAVNGQTTPTILNSSLVKVSYEYEEVWETVPEPSRILTLAIGLSVLMLRRRR